MKKILTAIALALGLASISCKDNSQDNSQDFEYVKDGTYIQLRRWEHKDGRSNALKFRSGCYLVNAYDGPMHSNRLTVEIKYRPEKGCQQNKSIEAVDKLLERINIYRNPKVSCRILDENRNEVSIPRSSAHVFRQCYESDDNQSIEACFKANTPQNHVVECE